MYCSKIQTWLNLRLFQRGLCILVLSTHTHTKFKLKKKKKNVAHLSSFDDLTIHACTVHKYKRGSSFVFSRGDYAYLYCPQKQTWLMGVTNMNSLVLGGLVGDPPQQALCLYTPRIMQPCYLLQQRSRHISLQQQRVYVN